MRIINGTHRGKIIKVPKGLPVRPTTDFAKEALFNILANKIDFENTSVLDLFSGTGHISLEFASRGSKQITSVDKNIKCVGFLKSICKELNLEVNTIKADVFDFLNKNKMQFDLIFADPPYDLQNISEINQLVFANEILNSKGILIIEHGPKTNLETFPGFTRHRKYCNVNFSFFENKSN